MKSWRCILLLILLVPLGARASYKEHFQNGRSLQKQGRHPEAIAEFDKALKFADKPGAQYYKAMSQIELKRFAEARKLLLKVQNHPDTPRVVKARIPAKLSLVDRQLELLAKGRPVRVTIKTIGIQGASVALNGKPAGFTPFVRLLKPGIHQLAIRFAGYKTHIENLTLRPNTPVLRNIALSPLPVELRISVPRHPGVSVRLNGKPVGNAPLTLKRLPGRYTIGITKPGFRRHTESVTLAPGKPLNREIELVQQIKPRPKRTSSLRLSAYIVGGIGLGILAGAGIVHGLSHEDKVEANDEQTRQIVAKDKLDSAKKKMKIAYALYAVGGTALISGLVMLIVDLTRGPAKKEKMDAHRLQILVQPNGIAVYSRF